MYGLVSSFDPEWLAARQPFDEAVLDRVAVAAILDWANTVPADRPLRVVDLGSGTGVALRRAARWLAGRQVEAFAVDADRGLLAGAPAAWAVEAGPALPPGPSSPPESGRPERGPAPYDVLLDGTSMTVVPLIGDLLRPLDQLGGPADGSVDLLLGHALADLLPLDRLATRAAALLRPGGLAHFALTYDGETAFEPVDDPALEARVTAAYRQHMDRPRRQRQSYGGSTAGRRLREVLEQAGLEVPRAAPAVWDVPGPGDPAAARLLLDRMLRFVVGSLHELGEPPAAEVHRWEASRRELLERGQLRLRVRHLDVLARRPPPGPYQQLNTHPTRS